MCQIYCKSFKKIRVFSYGEQKDIEQACDSKRWGTIILLSLYTGMRQREILALKWKDINFENRTKNISKQLSGLKHFHSSAFEKSSLMIVPIKTSRTIFVSFSIMDKLKEYKAAEKINREKQGKAYEDNDLVFCEANGHFVEPRAFELFFKKTLEEAGVKDGNFSDLRHTFVARLREIKAPVKMMGQFGNDGTQFTLETYRSSL